MANPEHLKILKKGSDHWNKWREENPKIVPNLSGTDLRKANLSKVNLSEANLSEVNLSEMVLVLSDFHGAKNQEGNPRSDSHSRQTFIGSVEELNR